MALKYLSAAPQLYVEHSRPLFQSFVPTVMCSLKSVALFAGLASAVGVSKRQQPIKQYPDYGLLAKCPGYTASNVVTSDTGLKADITLAGKACNAYGDDLKDLILEVTYETGEYA